MSVTRTFSGYRIDVPFSDVVTYDGGILYFDIGLKQYREMMQQLPEALPKGCAVEVGGIARPFRFLSRTIYHHIKEIQRGIPGK